MYSTNKRNIFHRALTNVNFIIMTFVNAQVKGVADPIAPRDVLGRSIQLSCVSLKNLLFLFD